MGEKIVVLSALTALRALIAAWIIYTSWFAYKEYRDTDDLTFPIIRLALSFMLLAFLIITTATVHKLSDLQDSSGQTASVSFEQQEEETDSKTKESFFHGLWTDQTDEPEKAEKRGR